MRDRAWSFIVARVGKPFDQRDLLYTERNLFMVCRVTERISSVCFILTKELWSLQNRQDAERKLQRNAANLVRQRD